MRVKKILLETAKANGVSVKEIQEEIQKAIDDAWNNPPDDGGRTAACQRKVPCKGKIPTPEEFIRYAARRIKKSRESML